MGVDATPERGEGGGALPAAEPPAAVAAASDAPTPLNTARAAAVAAAAAAVAAATSTPAAIATVAVAAAAAALHDKDLQQNEQPRPREPLVEDAIADSGAGLHPMSMGRLAASASAPSSPVGPRSVDQYGRVLTPPPSLRRGAVPSLPATASLSEPLPASFISAAPDARERDGGTTTEAAAAREVAAREAADAAAAAARAYDAAAATGRSLLTTVQPLVARRLAVRVDLQRMRLRLTLPSATDEEQPQRLSPADDEQHKDEQHPPVYRSPGAPPTGEPGAPGPACDEPLMVICLHVAGSRTAGAPSGLGGRRCGLSTQLWFCGPYKQRVRVELAEVALAAPPSPPLSLTHPPPSASASTLALALGLHPQPSPSALTLSPRP